tara:strand:- start:55 stop:249 length:195 start_codon:yes stop_codon:yes gene_type:complete
VADKNAKQKLEHRMEEDKREHVKLVAGGGSEDKSDNLLLSFNSTRQVRLDKHCTTSSDSAGREG